MIFNCYMPVNVIFGEGALRRISREQLPGKKALIVTGGTSAIKLGYIDRLQILLRKNAGQEESVVCSGITPNPSIADAEVCSAMAKENGCDYIIALGGGSSIDAAKAAALLAVDSGELWDYAMGSRNIENRPLPVIAIPTTAGTGSEVDPWMVITNKLSSEKIGFGAKQTFPVMAIIDPELMMSVPPELAAFQGFDALFHAIEGYISVRSNVVSDLLSLKSIELISHNLPEVFHEGKNPQAVARLALASTLSGVVETLSSCTAHHALSHSLNAYFPSLPHGAALIMLSDAYFKHVEAVCGTRYSEMAKAMGISHSEMPDAFLTALKQLKQACKVSNLHMSDYGITADCFEKCAENARITGKGLFSNDRCEFDTQALVSIFSLSYS
jgi:alcohol dehydrogenase